MDEHADPLDLLHDDGDGINEMCLLFDEDEKVQNKGGGNSGNPVCCIIFIAGSAFLFSAIHYINHLI